MFNVEKLLGKVIAEMTGSHHDSKYHHKPRKHHGDMIGGLAENLLSGKGLLTAIGLGVGAYTILKDKSTAGQQAAPPSPGVPPSAYPTNGYATTYQSPSSPPASPPNPARNVPPPPIPPAAPPRSLAGTPNPGQNPSSPLPSLGEEEVARRMLQVMIAAAHADGHLDQEEEGRILNHLRAAGLSREEKEFLLDELHHPKSVGEIAAGMNNPKLNLTLYSLAVSTIVIDTQQERKWLDELAAALAISPEMQRFIEE